MTEMLDAKGRRFLVRLKKCTGCGTILTTDYCEGCQSKRSAEKKVARESELSTYRQARYGEHLDAGIRRSAIFALAKPRWRDVAKIRAIYAEARRLTKETGVKYHVDHIYPLQNGLCCGLHVHENLQISTATENCQKNNAFPFDQSPAWGNLDRLSLVLAVSDYLHSQPPEIYRLPTGRRKRRSV